MSVLAQVQAIFEEQLGKTVPVGDLIREELGATSLDMASVQIAFEDTFGLVFGTGSARLPIDDAWDQAKTVTQFAEMVTKFAVPSKGE